MLRAMGSERGKGTSEGAPPGASTKPGAHEPTLQVRVRERNPPVELPPAAPRAEAPAPRQETALVPRGAAVAPSPFPRYSATVGIDPRPEARSIYEDLEHTDKAAELAAAHAVFENALDAPVAAWEAETLAAAPLGLDDGHGGASEAHDGRAQDWEESTGPDAVARITPGGVPALGIYLEEEETVVAIERAAPATRWTEVEGGFRAERRVRPSTRLIEHDEEAPAQEGEAAPTSAPPRGPRPARDARPAERPAPLAEEAPSRPAALPRQRLDLGGTDAAGVEVHRQRIDLLDRALPAVRSAELRPVRGALRPDALAILDSTLGGAFDPRGVDPAVSPKRTLEHLIHERSYQELDPEEQALLLTAISDDPRDVSTIKASIALLKTGAPRRLRQDERRLLLELFGDLGPDARVRLAQLGARQLRGRSALEDRDHAGRGLVEQLGQLVRRPRLAPELEALGLRPRKLVATALTVIAAPGRLSFEDGADGVLGLLEFALAELAPAELLRMWRQLASSELAVELAGKGTLDLGARLKERGTPAVSGRGDPVRAALEGLPALARQARSRRRSTFVVPGGGGLDAELLARALELLFGAPFTVAAGEAHALRALERLGTDRQRVPPALVSVLTAQGERLFVFDRLEADGLYVRAPHGKSTKRAGAWRQDPRREVVDPERSLERLPLEETRELLGCALLPRPAPPAEAVG
jgi:hypothetical protein